MQTGQGKSGMQTLNQCLATLYFTKQISLQTAVGMSSLPDELQDMINRGAGLSTPRPEAGRHRSRGRPSPPEEEDRHTCIRLQRQDARRQGGGRERASRRPRKR